MKLSYIRFAVPILPKHFQPFIGYALDNTFNFISNTFRKQCFSGGWGDQHLINTLMELSRKAQTSIDYKERDTLITSNINICITKEENLKNENLQILTGYFKSPASYLLPKQCELAYFQILSPLDKTLKVPLVIQYAMTGDHGFGLRKDIGRTLWKKHKIASLSIMNPFYGKRKPKEQSGSALIHVSDLMSKGAALVSEGLSLIEYLKIHKELGDYTIFGVTGISMGGHMAALAGSNSLDKLVVVPCLSPYSAGPVFTEGLLANWCNWDILDNQFPSYSQVIPKANNSKEYMLHLLNATTDICKFPKPKCLQATIQVAALYDGYVPNTGEYLYKHWPGSELRWTKYSHVSAIGIGKSDFISAIADGFSRYPKE